MSLPTERYARYRPWVIGFGAVYSLGMPAFFLYLVEHFQSHGEAGDQVVERALGWMYRPYRDSRVWWLGAEYVASFAKLFASLQAVCLQCRSDVVPRFSCSGC